MLDIRNNPILQRRLDDEQRELTASTTMKRQGAKRQMVEALHRKNAVRDIRELPGEGESLHIICRGNFPLWSVVPATLALATPARIDHLAIATLGFSTSNATDLLQMLDAGQVQAVDIVCSVYFERQNPAEYRIMAEGLSARHQRLIALRSHAKIIAMRLSDGRAFVVESSANLRSCRNIEQITLTQDKALTEFHAAWISAVIDAAQASEKPK
jgi:hypothetical protein